MKKQCIFAVSGIKNSGKTTLITKLIPEFKKRGLSVSTIKHDGHDFNADIEGTDTYLHRKSGADGTLIFSRNKYMLIEEKKIDLEQALEHFKDSDIIILEGFKSLDIDKIELVRSENSKKPFCNKKNVIAYVSDMGKIDKDIVQFDFNDISGLVEYILDSWKV